MREALAENLLAWYDCHARVLPWRIPPIESLNGLRQDPYKVWLSEIMLQQTTVVVVKDYYQRFTERWPTVQELAGAEDADVMAEWAGLGYYARARNLLKCARAVVSEHGGVFPRSRSELETLPGIGPYTSAAISAIAFDAPETVVDGNVERVMARLHAVQDPLPGAKKLLSSLAAQSTPTERAGDYAQAVMDLGATLCTPRNPACGVCPWRVDCAARAAGNAAELPRKTPKKPKPIRHGTIFVARNLQGDYLLEQRPEKGLLGGMLGFPGSEWHVDPPAADPPVLADWAQAPGEVRHTFTHFHLRLSVFAAVVAPQEQARVGRFYRAGSFQPSDLPTVMRKVLGVSETWFAQNPVEADKVE